MATSSETVSETIAVPAKGKAQGEEYFTYVEGVGSIPRDIYKHVQSDPLGDLPRYSVHIVIQHLLIFITFLLLVFTGLPIYFSDVFWAPVVIAFFGGIDTARLIHRIAGFTMMFAAAYHVVTIVGGTLRKIYNHEFDYKRTQIPRLKDLYDLIHDLKYFIGIEPYRPKMEKFMYKQKLHYLAIIWGSLVLIAAGSALLFPDVMARLIPGTLGKLLPQGVIGEESYSAFFQSLARLMHADEAVMALIVVAFWHWSNVHLVPGRFPMQWTYLTGRITREHQIEEHFLEYLNNLREIPEEREYMRNLLVELEIESSHAMPPADRQASPASKDVAVPEDKP
jgi:cytochrome b subunit of formate dehydrogenase